MHFPDTDDELQLLSDTLEVVPKPNEVKPEGLRQLLDDRIEDLRQLLETPGKSDVSRNKLKEGLWTKKHSLVAVLGGREKERRSREIG